MRPPFDDKRHRGKQCSHVKGGTILNQSIARNTTLPRTNWAGNLTYSSDRLIVPNTVAEAQEAVKTAKKMRVVGSRHCFNDIADTTGTHISLERLDRVLSLDTSGHRVTVEGGIRYGELGPYLHERGYALHNMASLPHISVAGACATATHGSGAVGNLAVAVAELEFINAEGDLVVLKRDHDESFAGAVVNLGALGVVTKLTLDVQPAFDVRQDVFCDLPIAALETHFDEIVSSGYSVSTFTVWQTDDIEQVWIKSALRPGVPFSPRETLFGARPATCNLHPMTGLDAIHCTEQMGVAGASHDRLPHFRSGFTPASGEELQVEYFVPREHAAAAIRAIRQQGHWMKDLVVGAEIRTIAADALWLSPCYQTPCVAFHFSFKRNWPALRTILPKIEEALAPLQPRPHWGKMFTMPPAEIQARYPRLSDFKALIHAHDPQGKFRNRFVDRTLFSGA